MNQDDREQIERALGRIPRGAWDALLESDEGRELARRREAVRETLRCMGKLPVGAPTRPTGDVVDLLGHRLLSDRTFGPWIRQSLLTALPSTKWDRLAQRYRKLAGKRAGELHGNATQEGKGSRVMADYWHQGGRWAEELCEALELPSVLATRREDPYPDDELISPTITLGPLHDFQVDVYTKLRDLLSGGLGRTALLSLPTGAGKTRVAVEALCDHLAAQPTGRRGRNVVLWIARSHELQMQAWSCFRQVWQSPPERADGRSIPRRVPLSLKRAWGGVDHASIEIDDGPTALIAGIDQLASWTARHPEFFDDFPRRRLAGVVIDEAHGVITNEHREVLIALGLRARHRWRPRQDAPPVIGLSATPWRTQETQSASLQDYFESNLLTPKELDERPIETLQGRAILADVRWERLRIEGSPVMTSQERRRFETFRDLPAEFLERLGEAHARNARIVDRLLRLPPRSRVLVFGCSVEHAEVLTLALNRAAGAEVAAVVTGRTPRAERVEVVERFREGGALRFLCNVGVLTMGFDAPKTDVVCITRPTTSAILYEQMVGRGLRGKLNGGTATCRVLDVQDDGLPEGIMSYARVKRAWDGDETDEEERP